METFEVSVCVYIFCSILRKTRMFATCSSAKCLRSPSQQTLFLHRILQFPEKQRDVGRRSVQRGDLSRLHLRCGRDVYMGRGYPSRWPVVHDDGHLRRPVRDGGLPESAVGTLEASPVHSNDRHSAHVFGGILRYQKQHIEPERHE